MPPDDERERERLRGQRRRETNPERWRQYQREYYIRYRHRWRESHLKRTYDISQDEYDTLAKAQNYSCKLCGKHASEEPRGNLVVDHCHETGRIRGLLCSVCNTGIGKLGDTIEGLEKALDYLKKNDGKD